MVHVELAPLGGIFGPLKSDLGVFWPFRGTDGHNGQKPKCKFLKKPSLPDFKIFVVICEVILQKKAPILAPVIFSVFTLISHCGPTQKLCFDIIVSICLESMSSVRMMLPNLADAFIPFS